MTGSKQRKIIKAIQSRMDEVGKRIEIDVIYGASSSFDRGLHYGLRISLSMIKLYFADLERGRDDADDR
jgi:hypothetical protein